MAYGGNIAFLQMIIGYVIARILLAIVLVPHYFKGEIYSPYQLFANTFGPCARQTAGGFFLILMGAILLLAALFYFSLSRKYTRPD